MIWNHHSMSARLVVAAVAVMAAGCSGGGGGLEAPRSLVSDTPSAKTSATVTIEWPTPGSAAKSTRRRPAYVSDGTKSVKILAAGTTTEVDNPNLTPGGTAAPTQTTSVVIPLAPSATPVVFTVDSYDAPGGTGRLLGSGTATSAIVSGTLNTIDITLSGELASIACAAVGPFTKATGTSGTAFSQVGIAGSLALTPKDAAGFTIVSPGAVPALTLAPADPTMASASAIAAMPGTYAITVTPSGTAEAFTASGRDLNGTAVSTTCSVTRDTALYVTNVGHFTTSSVTIYDATAANAAGGTVAAVPVATLGDPAPATAPDATGLVAPQFPAVDPKGDLFVSNQGPRPGATYGPTAGYVAIYGPGTGQVGNVAPIGYIPNLNRPEGVDFDGAGDLYVLSADRITVYPPSADGVTSPAVPSRTIAGSNTDLFTCYGMHVDAAGKIYAACSNVIDVFAAGANGNATATLILAPGNVIPPTMNAPVTQSSRSWLDVAADGTGVIYAPASNNNLNMIDTYQAGTSGGNTPPVSYASTGYSQPTGIFVTPASGFYIANRGNDSVDYFASATTLLSGLADTTYTGAATGLNVPFGVYAR